MSKSSVVYQTQCEDCPAIYIGQTKQTIKKRMASHKCVIKKLDIANSSLAMHIHKNPGHKFYLKTPKILTQDVRKSALNLKENFQILSNVNAINMGKDIGRIPNAYLNTLMELGMKHPPPSTIKFNAPIHQNFIVNLPKNATIIKNEQMKNLVVLLPENNNPTIITQNELVTTPLNQNVNNLIISSPKIPNTRTKNIKKTSNNQTRSQRIQPARKVKIKEVATQRSKIT